MCKIYVVQLSNTDHARVVVRNTLVKYDIIGQPESFTIVQLLPDKTGNLLLIYLIDSDLVNKVELR